MHKHYISLPVETIVCDRPHAICFTFSGFKPVKITQS